MGRKKNIQGIDAHEMDYINEKIGYTVVDKCEDIIRFSRLVDYKINIKCKNKKQKEFLNLLKNENKQLCFGIGSAGSGKSYISLAYALDALKDPSTPYRKIICFVPTCEAGAMSIGFLKGTLEEKIEPYLEADTYTMMKILDKSGNYATRQILDNLIKSKIINYELVNFARGKTYDDAIILLNESENYSKEEILLLLTRIGENSKIIISGDLQQLDRKDIKRKEKECGLQYAMEKLKDLDEFGIVKFTPEDIVRNPLITKIIDMWD
jgi:phosphate starvation-inducible PhoH-like protein